MSHRAIELGVAQLDDRERGVATPCVATSTFEAPSRQPFSSGEITTRPSTERGNREHGCGIRMGVDLV
ncbi:MAG TPA: hypothetical protein VIW24_13410, partial [Aldersonia sp.]